MSDLTTPNKIKQEIQNALKELLETSTPTYISSNIDELIEKINTYKVMNQPQLIGLSNALSKGLINILNPPETN